MTSIVMHYALPGARGQTRHFNYCALLDGDVRREAAHTDPVYSTHVRGPGFAVGRPPPPPLPHLTSPHRGGAGMGWAGLGFSEFSISDSDYLQKHKTQNRVISQLQMCATPLSTQITPSLSAATYYRPLQVTEWKLYHFPLRRCSNGRQKPGRWSDEMDRIYSRT